MSRILAVANIKGGVGKTTTTVNLAAALAERGCHVLAIDLDPQSSLTLSLGINPDRSGGTIFKLLEPGLDPSNSPIVSTSENWDLLPGGEDLRKLEHELETDPNRILAVGTAIQPFCKSYDFILLDCPASTGTLTGAALAASDEVVVPMTLDFLSFRASGALFKIINRVRGVANPRLRVAGIILTMYDTRTRHARDIMTSLDQTYGTTVPFFSAVIHQSVKLKEAPAYGQSVFKYAPDSAAAESYRVVAREIVEGIKVVKQEPPTLNVDPNNGPEANVALEAPPVATAADATSDYLAFYRATELDPKDCDAWVGRAETAPDAVEAISAWGRALQLNPFDTRIRMGLENSFTNKMIESTVADVPALFAVGDSMKESGNCQYAEQAYRRITELSPRNGGAWLQLARTSTNPLDQLSNAQRSLELDPGNEESQAELALAKERVREESHRMLDDGMRLTHSGQTAQAHLLFKHAVELDPRDDRAWLGCARTADNLPAKMSYLKQSLELNPDSAEAKDLYRIMNTFVSSTERPRWGLGRVNSKAVYIGLMMFLVAISIVILPRLLLH